MTGSGPSRILIVRTSAMGDVVHCLPALAALRRAFPRARIGWVVEEALAPLLDGHPDLDELLPVRLRPWRRRPLAPATLRQVGAFVSALDRFAPEAVLDLMGNHKAGTIAALTLADRRIGASAAARREPSSAVWLSEWVTPRGEHTVDRTLSLLAALGVEPGAADFGGEKLFPGAPAEVDGRRPGAADYALVLPGAGWANKRYPPERWGEVAAAISRRARLDVWIAWGPGEGLVAYRAREASNERAEVVAAHGLPQLAALLRHARLVLGGDTGPLHLAHALGTPVLCVMGPTDPATHGPYGAPERALYRLLPCSFCHKRLDSAKACLLDIPSDEVARRALELLS